MAEKKNKEIKEKVKQPKKEKKTRKIETEPKKRNKGKIDYKNQKAEKEKLRQKRRWKRKLKEVPSTQKRKKLKQRYQKKIKLAKQGKRTKWAPFWTVIKKYGQGKRVHPSQMTRVRRHWTRTKLKIKPRRSNKRFIG